MNSFYRGQAAMALFFAFFQDILGKDDYIELIHNHWINTPAWIWIIPLLVVFYFEFRTK